MLKQVRVTFSFDRDGEDSSWHLRRSLLETISIMGLWDIQDPNVHKAVKAISESGFTEEQVEILCKAMHEAHDIILTRHVGQPNPLSLAIVGQKHDALARFNELIAELKMHMKEATTVYVTGIKDYTYKIAPAVEAVISRNPRTVFDIKDGYMGARTRSKAFHSLVGQTLKILGDNDLAGAVEKFLKEKLGA